MSSKSVENHSPRDTLSMIYHSALQAVQGRQQVANFLCQQTEAKTSSMALIAIGKAATAMAAGAFDVFGNRIDAALVITKKGYLDNTLAPQAICLEAGHPLPDASSLTAGETLLNFIKQLPAQQPVLCLISGGASALVEVLIPGVTLADLQRVNHWLLGSGLDIHTLNHIRKRLSLIKGGRLATYLSGHSVLNLLISDVPGDDLTVIGSGLLTFHETQPALPVWLPGWLQTLTAQATPLAATHHFSGIQQRIIAHPATARQAACAMAAHLGYTVYSHETLIVDDAQTAGRTLARQLRTASTGVYVWSSETTVQLPSTPGQGGRCQQLALAAARELAGQEGIYLLAAGTDGSDGPGEVAGALVDGKTLARVQSLEAQHCLDNADAGRFLAASGDLLYTGPTGSNVMDILIGLKTG